MRVQKLTILKIHISQLCLSINKFQHIFIAYIKICTIVHSNNNYGVHHSLFQHRVCTQSYIGIYYQTHLMLCFGTPKRFFLHSVCPRNKPSSPLLWEVTASSPNALLSASYPACWPFSSPVLITSKIWNINIYVI